jgi:hypothetical protein
MVRLEGTNYSLFLFIGINFDYCICFLSLTIWVKIDELSTWKIRKQIKKQKDTLALCVKKISCFTPFKLAMQPIGIYPTKIYIIR